MRLKWINSADAEDLEQLDPMWSAAEYVEFGRQDGCWLQGAYEGDRIVGYVAYELDDKHYRVVRCFGQIGPIVSRMKERRSAITCLVSEDDDAIHLALAEAGFESVGVHRGYYSGRDGYLFSYSQNGCVVISPKLLVAP